MATIVEPAGAAPWRTFMWQEGGVRFSIPPPLAPLPQFTDRRDHLAFGSTATHADAFEALDLYSSRPSKDGDTQYRWQAWLTWLASTAQWQNLLANTPVGYKAGAHYGYRGSLRYTAKSGVEVVGALVVLQVHDAHIVVCYRCAAVREAMLGEVMNALLATVDFRVAPPTGKWVRAVTYVGVEMFLCLAFFWAIGTFTLGVSSNTWISTPVFAALGTPFALWWLRLIGTPLAEYRSMQARRQAAKERDATTVAEPQGGVTSPPSVASLGMQGGDGS